MSQEKSGTTSPPVADHVVVNKSSSTELSSGAGNEASRSRFGKLFDKIAQKKKKKKEDPNIYPLF